MKRVHLYSFLPVLLLARLLSNFFEPESRPSEESLVRDLSQIPVCGLSHVGGVPDALLKQTVVLRSGVGQFATLTSSKSEKAQAYFEQGMGYLHGYALIEAARSFHEALRHDSTMVMAHVGLSRVFMELDDNKAAYESAEAAQKLAQFASEREQAHVELRFVQLKAVDSLHNKTLLNEYRSAIKRQVKRFPQDAELWLMAGNAYEGLASDAGRVHRRRVLLSMKMCCGSSQITLRHTIF
ncbi:tetratricopeptide repeat protein [Spirosoma montaniterrae]|uniref:Uncharacterized protein n=1 Tax=Spirosoma montaniterrae TaxID=1178516 RepID=A0A1P9WZ93_9BACT|nr:hypothetical protein [Spirosoma montaniterrae]AQG80699.1 hypothetical protein AWR27_16010 [Spirosoma montaniterrae]